MQDETAINSCFTWGGLTINGLCRKGKPEGTDVTAQAVEEAAAIQPSQQAKTQESIDIIKDERTGVIPAVIEIPSIGVKAPVEEVGLLGDGEMDVPAGFDTTGWYGAGFMPGEPGNAVIAGHVDSKRSRSLLRFKKTEAW